MRIFVTLWIGFDILCLWFIMGKVVDIWSDVKLEKNSRIFVDCFYSQSWRRKSQHPGLKGRKVDGFPVDFLTVFEEHLSVNEGGIRLHPRQRVDQVNIIILISWYDSFVFLSLHWHLSFCRWVYIYIFKQVTFYQFQFWQYLQHLGNLFIGNGLVTWLSFIWKQCCFLIDPVSQAV